MGHRTQSTPVKAMESLIHRPAIISKHTDLSIRETCCENVKVILSNISLLIEQMLLKSPQDFLTPSTTPSQTRATLYKLPVPNFRIELYKNYHVMPSFDQWNGLHAVISHAQTWPSKHCGPNWLHCTNFRHQTTHTLFPIFTLFLFLNLHFYVLLLF